MAPSLRRRSASSRSVVVSMLSSAKNAALPSASRLPSTTPTTPLPAGALKPRTGARSILRSVAAVTIAAASGCSLPRSVLAAKCSTCVSSKPDAGTIATTFGLPSVSVPVLSMTRVSIFSIRSRCLGILDQNPRLGAASYTHHDRHRRSEAERAGAGDDQTRSLPPPARRRSAARGRTTAHDAKAMSATAITVGTNQPATWSASRWIGARLRCASPPSARFGTATCRVRPCRRASRSFPRC